MPVSTEVTQTFAALADPVRGAIVDRLVGGDATVGELAGMFPITMQAVSQQIGTLERAGLVTRHREGRTRRVHLNPAGIEKASRWLEARRQRLEERYRRLDEVLADVLATESPVTASGDIDSSAAGDHPTRKTRKDRP